MAHAHSVVVWAERVGDSVQVETFLSDGGTPKSGTVEVIDASGDRVAGGDLDRDGRFYFSAPDKWPVTINVTPSAGHTGSFTLDADSAQ